MRSLCDQRLLDAGARRGGPQQFGTYQLAYAIIAHITQRLECCYNGWVLSVESVYSYSGLGVQAPQFQIVNRARCIINALRLLFCQHRRPTQKHKQVSSSCCAASPDRLAMASVTERAELCAGIWRARRRAWF
ncbi:hypothetical protein NDU88_003301 [Pleurodeles waltl]|uniref:Uncharacterized protein n=1 Tax=Pleurodeles waltl TaxID=8319 RepID=A0AAV7UC51_PLEWA|nr:hypothetical protein NDU88_003301 [Pleurodeles waltl]